MQTDQHALATLIYMYLTQRHPLKGRKAHDVNDSANDDSFRTDNYRVTVYDGIGLYAWHTNRFKSSNERLDPQERRRLAYL